MEIATLIEQKIAEMRWDKLLAQPQSEAVLRTMTIDAMAEDDAGLMCESGETW